MPKKISDFKSSDLYDGEEIGSQSGAAIKKTQSSRRKSNSEVDDFPISTRIVDPKVARRKAAKLIALMERQGGLLLECDCFVSVQAGEMRKLMSVSSPEDVLDAIEGVRCEQHLKPKKTRRKVVKVIRK